MPASRLDQMNTEVMEYTGQPEFDEIRRRAGRRRTRRHTRSAVAVALAVAVGAGVTWGVGPAGRPRDVATPPSMVPSGLVPFPDGPQAALEAGVTALIQPGGSKRDEEVTAAVRDAGAVMVLTGRRHFRH